MGWNAAVRDRRVVGALAWVGALAPAARLGWLIGTDHLGANPVEFVIRSLGTWTLVLLCATLLATPLRHVTGWGWPVRVRRTLGLSCFGYGVLHALAWSFLDQSFDIPAMLHDVARRPFITAGVASLVLLVPLALTSNRASQRRLGRRWGQLHRLVYGVALIAMIHLGWHKAGKHDYVQPLLYGGVIAVLLAARLPSLEDRRLRVRQPLLQRKE